MCSVPGERQPRRADQTAAPGGGAPASSYSDTHSRPQGTCPYNRPHPTTLVGTIKVVGLSVLKMRP